jgi:3-deoxy-D-manno-octulosonic acid kinase
MTEAFEIKTIETLSIGASIMLTDGQLSSLSHLCRQPAKRTRQPTKAALGGRTAVYEGRIEGIGPVVVKPYRRGGFVRHLTKRHYLKFGPTRCQHEFELLQTVRQLGVSTPEPVAFAYCGRLCYLCWLITRGIPQPKSLVRLANTDVASAQRVMPSVIEQISKLIEHRILHIDLHPGNIIVDKDDRVFIIDFDRGRIFNGDRNKLCKLYLQRWQRAVDKHRLPVMLTDMIRGGLFGDADQTAT